jgi:Xaa-Pro aminopeptidase
MHSRPPSPRYAPASAGRTWTRSRAGGSRTRASARLFGHGLGHGVGLEIHEPPRMGPRSDDVLAEGDVVSVEPGVYLPGRFGVRIEDLVVITADGHRNLSSLSKELRVVG